MNEIFTLNAYFILFSGMIKKSRTSPTAAYEIQARSLDPSLSYAQKISMNLLVVIYDNLTPLSCNWPNKLEMHQWNIQTYASNMEPRDRERDLSFRQSKIFQFILD